MAHNFILFLSIGTILGWVFVIGLLLKIFCDHRKEITMIKDIKSEVNDIKQEFISAKITRKS